MFTKNKIRLTKICPKCSKEFKVVPSKDRIVCCSISCAKKGHKPRLGTKHDDATKAKMRAAKLGIRGPSHWNWKDGGFARTERSRAMARDEYIQWRQAVFIRDGFECQICYKKGKLHAHHVKEWKHYPDLRYDLDNGVTLCIPCHFSYHRAKTILRPYRELNRGG